MRFAFFSSLITRSSTARSSLQGLVALSALVVLTGAKGQGCGSVDVPTTPPEPDCGPGFHWETVCSPCEIGEMCEEQCVSDNVCPPGWSQQTFCGGSSTSVTTSAGQGGMDGGVAMPIPPDECWTDCVPPQPFCPPGTIQQTVCSGGVTTVTTGVGPSGSGGAGGSGGWGSASSSVSGGGAGGGTMPMPPDECWTDCVPVEPYCPPGTQAQTVCGGSTAIAVTSSSSVGVGGSGGSGGWAGTGAADPGGSLPYPGDCWTDCVPVEPYCPPGTQAQEVCYDGMPEVTVSVGTGYGSGSSSSGGCFIDCVPVEPYCPPDTIPQTVCEEGSTVTSGSTGTGTGGSPYPGGGCRTDCIPVEPYCPPGTLEQQVCPGAGSTGTSMDDPAYPGECWIDCVEGSICPPESIERTICEQPADGGSPPVCRTECVLMLP